MCIIVAKPKGVKLPKKETLKTCFENNSDGAGIMFVKNDQVRILKGFMTFDDFIKGLNKVKKICKSDLTDKSIVMHFRIGTKGANNKCNTHPFPITNNVKDMKKTIVTNSLGIAHNGIISSYYYDNELSDTQAFIKDFLAPIKEHYKDFYKDKEFKRIILKQASGSNKFAILDTKEHITLLGEFINDKGVLYSNEYYKNIKTFNYGSIWNYSYNEHKVYNTLKGVC